MKAYNYSFPFQTLEDYMKQAGITNGYQTRPCLDPFDPECPKTAPNYRSSKVNITHTHCMASTLECKFATALLMSLRPRQQQEAAGIRASNIQFDAAV